MSEIQIILLLLHQGIYSTILKVFALVIKFSCCTNCFKKKTTHAFIELLSGKCYLYVLEICLNISKTPKVEDVIVTLMLCGVFVVFCNHW